METHWQIDSATDDVDAEWDEFLQRQPVGQFQQTARWARVKAGEGWQPLRIRFRSEPGLEGGFQLLWKHSRLGRIGYVSKGPALRDENESTISAALAEISRRARQLRLQAVIVQPPDTSRIGTPDLMKRGFCGAILPGIIDSTLVADVGCSTAEIGANMSATMRNESRKAAAKGVTITEGGRSDLAQFFELMLATCRRQGTEPNPDRVAALESIWDAFQPRVRVCFAELAGKKIAGLFLVGFGSRLTLWKKGWTSEANTAHPNSLLHVSALHWARDAGYREFDFVAVDRTIARNLLSNQPLTENQQRSRHMFHLRLGGKPRVLPSAHVLVMNPVLRRLFALLTRSERMRNLVFRSGKVD